MLGKTIIGFWRLVLLLCGISDFFPLVRSDRSITPRKESTQTSTQMSTQNNNRSENLNSRLVNQNRPVNIRAGSLARLGHLLDVQKVAGSSPARPTTNSFFLLILSCSLN
jgi:hypothetical protein